jgi:acyl-coenzyme A thioesterase PaaI-like protein
MTDIGGPPLSVPYRLGANAQFEDGQLTLGLVPSPEMMHHGLLRASVLSYMIDVVAGITVDDDSDLWTLTTDMTVRMRPQPPPARVLATNRVLRRGHRSSTCLVDVTGESGSPLGAGAIGFANIPRKSSDPVKPTFSPEVAAEIMSGTASLSQPLRDEAGIKVVDPGEGVVEVAITPELLNPAGTLQGAMVALVAEAAAEDFLEHRFGTAVVVTDLDLRYLARTHEGPVRSRCRILGTDSGSPVQVELTDTSTDQLTTLVYARASMVTVDGSITGRSSGGRA